jgi:hypothetical protein
MPISGVAAFLEEFRKPDPNYVPTESWLQRRDRLQLEKKERQERKIKEGLENCKFGYFLRVLERFGDMLFARGWIVLFLLRKITAR